MHARQAVRCMPAMRPALLQRSMRRATSPARYRLAEVRHERCRLAGYRARRWRRFADGCRQFLLGMAEGFVAARRYRRLLTLSDAELSQLGVTRNDLAWYAMSGKPRR